MTTSPISHIEVKPSEMVFEINPHVIDGPRGQGAYQASPSPPRLKPPAAASNRNSLLVKIRSPANNQKRLRSCGAA